MYGGGDSMEGKAHVIHAADLGLIPGVPYVPPRLPGMILEPRTRIKH